jgi:hypothetical protein
MIDQELAARLHPYLFPGERLLWTGRPVRGLRFMRRDWLLVPFSLAWAGFMIFWNVSVWSMGAPLEFTLFGIFFLLAGLYLVAGRFAVDALVRARSVYGVTNRRILILRRAPFADLRSFEIGFLPVLELEERAGGRGTIRFDLPDGDGRWWMSRFDVWLPAPGTGACFDHLADPRRVYDLIVRETERWRREQYGEQAVARSFIG